MPLKGGAKRKFPRKRRALTRIQRKQTKNIAKNVVKGLAEKKYHDVIDANASGSYDNAYIQPLNKISQGDSDTTRDGDTIRMSSLEFRGNISWANNASAVGRLIILCQKPGDLALSSASSTTYGLDDFLSAGATAGATYDMY